LGKGDKSLLGATSKEVVGVERGFKSVHISKEYRGGRPLGNQYRRQKKKTGKGRGVRKRSVFPLLKPPFKLERGNKRTLQINSITLDTRKGNHNLNKKKPPF